MTTGRRRIVVLAQPGPSTNIVANALNQAFGEVTVVVEEPVPRSQFVRRRAKRLGLATTAGQLLFSVLVVPLLRRAGRARVRRILQEGGLVDSPVRQPVVHVPSVNSDHARRVLRELDPAVVVVSGTRILGADTLGCVDAPFINMHAGITPQYRGVHGGYWALAEGRPDLVGTTVHVVDTGIDTGPILGQATFAVTGEDSFATYPFLHVAAGLPLLIEAVGEVIAGKTLEPRQPRAPDLRSTLRTHPTLSGYLVRRLRSGVA